MKKSSSREFFEVFRRLPEGEKTKAWWSKKNAPATDSAPAPVERKPKTAALRPARDTTTPPGRLKLTFSHEAVAIFGVVAILALIASHVWGYKRGVDSRLGPTDGPQIAKAGTDGAGGAGGNPAGIHKATLNTAEAVKTPFHTLLLMPGTDLTYDKALEIAQSLRGDGHDAFVLRRSSRAYTVCVGRFANKRAAEATKLKDTFDKLAYRGNNWFRSCRWEEIKDSGSIVNERR